MSHWFDRLSRASAPDEVRLDRRTTLKLAGAAALAVTPLGAAAAAAPSAQADDAACNACLKASLDNLVAGTRGCLSSHPPLNPIAAVKLYGCLWAAKITQFTSKARCKDTVCAPGAPLPTPTPSGGTGTPPTSSGGCAPGTSACPSNGGDSLCCYGGDACCVCAAAGGYICCAGVIGCTCCG
jgi:hypothetical protein